MQHPIQILKMHVLNHNFIQEQLFCSANLSGDTQKEKDSQLG